MPDYQKYYIPRTLDEPERILFFTYGELAIFLLPTFIGIAFSQIFLGMLAGFVAYYLFKKINPSNNGYSITHLMYWYAPSWLFTLSCVAPSHIRIYIGMYILFILSTHNNYSTSSIVMTKTNFVFSDLQLGLLPLIKGGY